MLFCTIVIDLLLRIPSQVPVLPLLRILLAHRSVVADGQVLELPAKDGFGEDSGLEVYLATMSYLVLIRSQPFLF